LPGIIKLFLARESFVTELPAGDGKIANLFLQCSINVADPDRQKLSINVVYQDTQKLRPHRISIYKNLISGRHRYDSHRSRHNPVRGIGEGFSGMTNFWPVANDR
jgi:hypothetical protein